MERVSERRREPEPVIYSTVIEQSQQFVRDFQQRLENAPRVVKFNQYPTMTNAMARHKQYTQHEPANEGHIQHRAKRLAITSFNLREQIFPPGMKSGVHRHFLEAVFYIIEGEGHVIHDGVKYPWEAGDVICVPTYCIHERANSSNTKEARMLVSTHLVFELLGLESTEQIKVNANYRPPSGAKEVRDSQGEIIGYKYPDGLELKIGADPKLQALMEAKKQVEFAGQPRDTYDRYCQTLVEQTRWRFSMPHVVKGREIPWENTRMGKIKHLVSPYRPSPLMLYDVYVQEIPPGGHSGKHRHVSEEAHKILSGRGYDIHDGKRYDWEAEDVVAVPINTVHQHFNASPDKPATFVSFQSRIFHHLGHGGFEHMEDTPDYRA